MTAAEILDDKFLFHKFIQEYGHEIYMPHLYISMINGQEKIYDYPQYPCVYKPVIARGGEGTYIANSAEDIKREIRDEIIEEYIDSPTEYVSHFSSIDGNIIYSVTFKTDYEGLHIKKGDIKNYTIENRNDEIFNIIFAELKYTGFACANFKIKDGQIKIFEINPRLGGSILNNKKYLTQIRKA